MARASRYKDFLDALLSSAYLPDELPPAITGKHYAKFCSDHFKHLEGHQARLLKLSTTYDTFTAPKNTSGRRHLALVHPLAQLSISLLLTKNRTSIRSIVDRKEKMSCYDMSDGTRVGKGFSGLHFSQWREKCAQLSAENEYVLVADISRFFYTAYTHSLPWAVLGKERVKHLLSTNRSALSRQWCDKLDKALQSCQSRETFGIPVGPDTSRVIAEILMAGVESDSEFSALITKRKAVRLVDDFKIGFDDEPTATAALTALRAALWKFNLQLNEEKTRVVHSRELFEEKWKLDFSRTKITEISPDEQKKEIRSLLELALHSCFVSRSSNPAIWACRRISWTNIHRENAELVVDFLVRLARDFPPCTKHVVIYLVNHQWMCTSAYARSRVERWIKSVIRRHMPQSHDFEVAWCLMLAGVLKVRLCTADFESFEARPNSAVFALLGMLRERKLLEPSLEKWQWRAQFKKNGIYGEDWLPFYEAVRRGWTKDKGIVTAIRSEPIFKEMLQNNVTFIANDILDAKSINTKRRVFSKYQKPPAGTAVQSSKKSGFNISDFFDDLYNGE